MKTISTPLLVLTTIGLFFSSSPLTNAQVPLADPERQLSMVKGATTSIVLREEVQIVEPEKPSIISAKPLPNGLEVRVTALSEGTSALRITSRQGNEVVYRISVATDLESELSNVKAILKEVEGISIEAIGQMIVIKGKILTPQDEEVIKLVCARHSSILNLASLEFPTGILKQKIESDLREKEGITTVKVQVIQNKSSRGNDDGVNVMFSGTVINEQEKQALKEVAGAWLPHARVSDLTTIASSNIRIDFDFLGLTLDKSSSSGNNILETLGAVGQFSVGGDRSGTPKVQWGVSVNAQTGIKLLQGQGTATNIFHTWVVTKSGTQGTSQSGSTENVTVAGNVGGDVVPIDTGVIIRVTPRLLTRTKLELEFSVQVSFPVPGSRGSYTVQKLFDGSQTLDCNIGQSVVLSGLQETFNGKTAKGTPVLKDIPVLNWFFSEKSKAGRSKQLLAVITPSLDQSKPAVSVPTGDHELELIQQTNSGK